MAISRQDHIYSLIDSTLDEVAKVFSSWCYQKSLDNINQSQPNSPQTYINKTECSTACKKYQFSLQPIAEDFKDLENFLVPNITTKERFRELKFHTDIKYDFEKMGKRGIFGKNCVIWFV